MRDKPKDIRELLTAESVTAYREHVIEECARVADSFKVVVRPERIAAAIRALKGKPLEVVVERLRAAAELAHRRLLDVVRNGDGEPGDVEALEALHRALKDKA